MPDTDLLSDTLIDTDDETREAFSSVSDAIEAFQRDNPDGGDVSESDIADLLTDAGQKEFAANWYDCTQCGRAADRTDGALHGGEDTGGDEICRTCWETRNYAECAACEGFAPLDDMVSIGGLTSQVCDECWDNDSSFCDWCSESYWPATQEDEHAHGDGADYDCGGSCVSPHRAPPVLSLADGRVLEGITRSTPYSVPVLGEGIRYERAEGATEQTGSSGADSVTSAINRFYGITSWSYANRPSGATFREWRRIRGGWSGSQYLKDMAVHSGGYGTRYVPGEPMWNHVRFFADQIIIQAARYVSGSEEWGVIRWKDDRGATFPKRLRRAVYKETGINVPDELIAEIGTVVRDQIHAASTMDLVVDDRLHDLERWWYGNPDSCWWTEYAASRCGLVENLGFGLISIDPKRRSEIEDEPEEFVTGRVWVIALAETSRGTLTPTRNASEIKAYLTFNGYGLFGGRPGDSLFAEITGMKVARAGRYLSMDSGFVNNNSATLFAARETMDRIERGDLEYPDTHLCNVGH